MKFNKVILWVMKQTLARKYQHSEVTFQGTLKMGAGHLDRTLVLTYQSLSGNDSHDHDVNSGSNTTELPPRLPNFLKFKSHQQPSNRCVYIFTVMNVLHIHFTLHTCFTFQQLFNDFIFFTTLCDWKTAIFFMYIYI